MQGSGAIAASFDGFSIGLGQFSAAVADRAQMLRTGLPLASFAGSRKQTDKEIELLVRRLAGRGLVEYSLTHPRNGADQVVIEPQIPDYWPRPAKLRDSDTLVLSRFAYLRRRASELVLESPRAGALFKICEPKIAAALAGASRTPTRRASFVRIRISRGSSFFHCWSIAKSSSRPVRAAAFVPTKAITIWCCGTFTTCYSTRAAPKAGTPIRRAGSTLTSASCRRCRRSGRHGRARQSISSPLAAAQPTSAAVKLFRERRSTRDFDGAHPITLAELAQFLDGTARVQGEFQSALDHGEGSPELTYTVRPYPSGGASYELELYLAVDACEGLPRGFYHYDSGGHALVPIDVRTGALDAMLGGAAAAMGANAAPQILITIAARFGRVSWKYSSLAYALILKDVGVLMQTLYLMAADMELGACAIGSTNIDLFAKMTGLEFHIEGAVGQFALGRGMKA